VNLIVVGIWQGCTGESGALLSRCLPRDVLWASIPAMFGIGSQAIFRLWLPESLQVSRSASGVSGSSGSTTCQSHR
jgi:hypothetical protein